MARRNGGSRDADWSSVDMGAIGNYWTIYKTDPVLMACRTMVLSSVLGQGILFADAKSHRMVDKNFFEHVQRHYVAFARDVIDAVYVQGWAAYTVDKATSVPHCVPPGAGQYRFRLTKSWKVELGLFGARGADSSSDVPERDVFFVVDTIPDLSGAINSAMASYSRSRYFKDLLERQAIVAETLRARPPLYTTMRTSHAFNEADIYRDAGPSLGAAIANSLSEERTRANMLVRNRILMDTYKSQDRLVRSLNARAVDTSQPGWEKDVDPMTGLPAFRADASEDDGTSCPIIPLPADAAVAHAPSAAARTDLVHIQEYVARMGCLVMGVPPYLVGIPQTGAVTALVTTAGDQLRLTSERFRYILTQLLLDVYELLYETREGLTVVFPSMQDSAQMKELFSGGVLTYEAYCDFISGNMELSARALEKKDPRAVEREMQMAAKKKPN